MLAELRYSARGLRRTPGLTGALFLTIAIGVGGNAMIYGFIRGSLNRTSGVHAPEGLVSISQHDRSGGFMPLSADQLEAIVNRDAVFESAGGLREDHDDVSFHGVSTAAL